MAEVQLNRTQMYCRAGLDDSCLRHTIWHSNVLHRTIFQIILNITTSIKQRTAIELEIVQSVDVGTLEPCRLKSNVSRTKHAILTSTVKTCKNFEIVFNKMFLLVLAWTTLFELVVFTYLCIMKTDVHVAMV